ncbi:DUF1491 family protein [Sphingobium ummariense]|uniref:DUF1491 family protein n=1 Tax=Sphingobium ummariense RL-3 TaxID=1346791 RepID=T0KBX7_9SPHN|nr:DUF1491 family protein [Sphingobium ummariense]EQB31028.1 hypothetical protein M529_17075 [Sphingobium ummariense RL-3]
MAAERLTSAMLAGALLRRAGAAGGFATVLVKGDPTSGVILVQAVEKGQEKGLFERVPDYEGGYRLVPCGPGPEADAEARSAYVERRRRADPDLWIIELDIAEAERFAAETIC